MKIFYFVTVILGLTAFLGCSKDKDDAADVLRGKWVFVEGRDYSGTTGELIQTIPGTNCSKKSFFEFKGGHKWSMEEHVEVEWDDNTVSCEYIIREGDMDFDGKLLILRDTFEDNIPHTYKYKVKIVDGRLELEDITYQTGPIDDKADRYIQVYQLK